MRVEVLAVADCPNGPLLEDRLAQALDGRPDCQVERHVVGDEADAARRGMHGSPTLLIDGSDPFAAPGTPTSFACRLYRDHDGTIGGAPSVEDLRRVLNGADLVSLTQPAGRAGRGRLAPAEGGLRAVQQAVLRSFAATGSAPTTAALDEAAGPFGLPAAQVLAELAAEDFLVLDDSGVILGAYPFSAVATEHVVQIAGGPMVFSMCAIDALGIPPMLGADAVVTSSDPVNGATVRVEFSGGAAAWKPSTAVVYYGARDQHGPAAAVCCDYLRFFTDRHNAEQWAGQQAGLRGAIVGQAEAERIAATIFGSLLAASPQ
ncbi:alkylmercury lyase family protein [Streptomyces sp. ISL-94]|uniref:alkylmercury lyase family protein n=1 Tax=Streptomyces sp. ISL-94 TaxID=2819190 RepID=UPI001BEC3DAA|nr:alkylmercury lyase family protein [Streptomyces sp. ISL-94]MBT2476833.1 alkylmercury lyase family protein [Streptomyces sp. ISL-94]